MERLREAFELATTETTERKRLLVIVNPYATTVSDRLKHLVVYALQGRYDVHAVDTQRRGHATELCREAAREGYDVVVAFGGDGTVNEAANGLLGTETPLTCLPGGSNNVFCKMLEIPADVVDATEHLLQMADKWEPRPADLAGVMLTRASPIDVPTIIFRALSGAARIARHRKVEAFAGVKDATVRSLDGRAIPFQV